MCSYSNSIKRKIKPFAVILLLFCGAMNGLTDLTQKIFSNSEFTVGASVFGFYTYVFAAIILLILYLALSVKGEKPDIGFSSLFPYVPIMALFLFLYSFFKTLAAYSLDSMIIYPLSQTGGMILSTIMAAVFFGEKINRRLVIGLIMAIGALLLMNL